MKLTIIGYWGAYPGKNEGTSAYLLEGENTKILLDCGSGAVARLQNHINLATLDAVVLSHYHHDHVADIGVLQYSRVVDMNLKGTTEPLHIYAHKDDLMEFNRLGKKPYAEVFSYNSNGPLSIGPFTFSFQKTNHPVPCYAMKITDGSKSFVYTADTTYDEALIPFIQGSDLLITETSFYEDQEAKTYGHMNSKEAGTLAEKSDVQHLILSHLPHFGSHNQLVEEAKKYFSGNIQLAASDLVWPKEN
ncbi:MBL fold metallo-hydrolase [Evansella sp. AB-P1]|uniref:MBL fold metallo-hydrolase n=1 Tax=Evansella sp. AB-P1 TaxID=3037653 RepID=UPI00241EE8C5|nr:MBL fold metallo-hydrolase [Evansella sp. AB-P1]MDG5786838.1 MBL fold metallo-hydrolase [Evansella sp. AB-P1]